ncbi:MAG: phage major capsid protein [Rhizobiales bacterium]|nr:phage major capsid protein [Hyphomicrobiales bacterium]
MNDATGRASRGTGSGAANDVAGAFEGFMRAFEAFKETNDERLAQIERRFTTDVVTSDKLERINHALDRQKRVLDEVSFKGARTPRDGQASERVSSEHRARFHEYVRHGEAAGLVRLEGKALSQGSNPDGGYLVPEETERQVMRALSAISPMRAISGNRQVSGTVYKKPFTITGPGAGWVGETAARPETASPTLDELSFPTMELYAMPAATATLLDDAAVDIDQWIAEEVRVAFAEQEGAAFVHGNGTTQPKGLLTYTKVANASWSWGNLGYLATGVSGGFPASAPSDKLIDLVYAVRAGYRANGHWLMNRGVQGEIRKIKDADGNYIWQPAPRPGEAPMLLNFPVAEAEEMPDIAADSFSIAFGDFSRGYLVVDRIGIRVLRDPYSSKPYVLFYTTKRVGGGVQDFNAIKLLRFAAA